VYRGAYFDAQMEGDHVLLKMDGLNMAARIDATRGLMSLSMAYNVKAGTNRQQILELCNRVNDGLIFIRACFPAALLPRLVVYFDHFIDTNAGVTGLEIVDETRRFRNVINSVPPLDSEHILA